MTERLQSPEQLTPVQKNALIRTAVLMLPRTQTDDEAEKTGRFICEAKYDDLPTALLSRRITYSVMGIVKSDEELLRECEEDRNLRIKNDLLRSQMNQLFLDITASGIATTHIYRSKIEANFRGAASVTGELETDEELLDEQVSCIYGFSPNDDGGAFDIESAARLESTYYRQESESLLNFFTSFNDQDNEVLRIEGFINLPEHMNKVLNQEAQPLHSWRNTFIAHYRREP